MPRPLRIYPAGVPQHVYNRGNKRQRVFHERADYLGFLAGLADAAKRTTVRIVAFIMLGNHWHLILWPSVDEEVSQFMQLLMNTHIRDLLLRRDVRMNGHFYRGRHKNRPILTERQLWLGWRYVEGNALKHGLVDRAEDWPWSSLSDNKDCAGIVHPGPFPKPRNWVELANQIPSDAAMKEWHQEARKAQKLRQFRVLGETVPQG